MPKFVDEFHSFGGPIVIFSEIQHEIVGEIQKWTPHLLVFVGEIQKWTPHLLVFDVYKSKVFGQGFQ